MYAGCSLSLPPGTTWSRYHVYAYVHVHISRYHLTSQRNTHYGAAYYGSITTAARYHLIKITKRNIADFDFRLKVCTYMCSM